MRGRISSPSVAADHLLDIREPVVLEPLTQLELRKLAGRGVRTAVALGVDAHDTRADRGTKMDVVLL